MGSGNDRDGKIERDSIASMHTAKQSWTDSNERRQRSKGERFTGHGSEWRDANLSPRDAHTATAWVEQVIDKRSMEVNKDRVEDVRDVMWQLEKEGEIVVHRVSDEHQPRIAKTIYGWDKKIPTTPALAPQSPAVSAAIFRVTRPPCCG